MAAKEARRGEKISVRVCNKMCSLKRDFYAKQTTSTIERPPAVIVRYINIHAEHLDVKYNGNNRYYAADCFVNSRPIFARLMSKFHSKILWRLRPNANISNPCCGEFTHDVPFEVWDVVFTGDICSFGHAVLSSTEVVV